MSKSNKEKKTTVKINELREIAKKNNWKVLVNKQSNGWFVSVQGEHGAVSHSLGMSVEQAAENILEVLTEYKLAPTKKTKPAAVYTTKETKE
jgi:predicted RNase H-like HicB family nuclease